VITTVTLNPMLDKTVEVDAIRRGGVKRATKVYSIVGGKGVNVSRQLNLFGFPTRATGFLGGEIGTMLERLLKEEGIANDFVRIEGMTREGVTYREPDGTWTAIFEPPHAVLPAEAEQLIEKCAAFIKEGGWLVCSGSSPAIESDHVFRSLILESRRCGTATVLDSYGEAFTKGLEAVPTVAKLNRDEYELSLGKVLRTDADFVQALQQWTEMGVTYGIITDGPRSLYAAGPDGSWKVSPPSIVTVNATGSGDSLVAGLLQGFERQWPFEESLSFGVAAGAANARKWEVANSTYDEVVELKTRVIIRRLQS